jgi:predicted transporter
MISISNVVSSPEFSGFLSTFGTVSEIVMAIATVLAVVFAAAAWSSSRRAEETTRESLKLARVELETARTVSKVPDPERPLP